MRGLRGGDDGTVGEDDFEGEDVVAAEAGSGAEVADASCSISISIFARVTSLKYVHISRYQKDTEGTLMCCERFEHGSD